MSATAIVTAYLAGASMATVGRRVGLTRERIRQILVERGVTYRHPRRCRVSLRCEQCGRSFEVSRSAAAKARFCSAKCMGLAFRTCPHVAGGAARWCRLCWVLRMREWIARQVAAGRCAACGKRPPRRGLLDCGHCAHRKAITGRAWREREKAMGR